MNFLITSSLIIGAVFLLGASTSLNAIDMQPLTQHNNNIIKVHGHGDHGHYGGGHGYHHGHHGWNGGWGGWGGGFYGGPGYYYGGPGYYVEPGPGICIGPLCIL
ncbi:MAG: hypothetical protein K2X02_08265 [Alphaproteobacteria bacterium]|nr:hypothetical protein [Alphaproteobacteria bacterium]